MFIFRTVAHRLTPLHYHLLFLSGLPLIPLIVTIGVAFGVGSDYYVVTSDDKLMYVCCHASIACVISHHLHDGSQKYG